MTASATLTKPLASSFSNEGYLGMEMLRFTTAGSVDDGKSTLIGRLLYDSKSIFEDQYDAIVLASETRGEEYVNLALLTDGLRAEREQGITIDVAYRYFATPKRKFIIADTPGHTQYTRNMVTGASTADLAIVLVDARKGVIEQTRRHALIASLLRIPYVVLCVNKMDLVGYEPSVFEAICAEFEQFAKGLDVQAVYYVPISALLGDNVVEPSENMDWYKGTTLMSLLEQIPIPIANAAGKQRFPIQYVLRPQSSEHHDFRGYAGRVAGGTFSVGDLVTVLPSGFKTQIKSIHAFHTGLTQANEGQSVTITLTDEIDISRGDMLTGNEELPIVGQDLEMMICWFSGQPLTVGQKFVVRQTTRETRGIVKSLVYKLDIQNLAQVEGETTLEMNEIAKINLKTMQPLVYDPYAVNRTTGSLILIDEATNVTVGAGMLLPPS